MKTRITELLGIEYPVVQGAMARIADGGLAGAVSEAGGLGIIACGGARPEWIREQVARARALTSKPIGINVMLMDPRASEVAELVCELSVEVVTTGAGSPANYMKMWKDAGVKVVPVVAPSALAARMERLGADAVVAEGTEAGGHIGESTTMVLVPQIVDAVNIPVIAAGGIADGRGIAAAFMLGAKGVQMGTAFIVTEECQVHENYKNEIQIVNSIPFDRIKDKLQNNNCAKVFSENLNKEKAISIFSNNILTYFPSYRYEQPYYLNDPYKFSVKFNVDSEFNGYLANPIEVTSGIGSLGNWIMDVVLDWINYKQVQ